jgi:hypothetical protein
VGCLVYSAFSDSRDRISNRLRAAPLQVWATVSALVVRCSYRVPVPRCWQILQDGFDFIFSLTIAYTGERFLFRDISLLSKKFISFANIR